jgi:hypothetical protein
MENNEVELVTSGIDWVSCTLDNREVDYHVWRGDVIYALEQVAKQGYEVQKRRLLGYEGLSAGNCFVGENDRGTYCQFTGEKADWAYDYTIHPKTHYSRIDVQTTVKYREYQANIGKAAYRDSIRGNELLPAGRKRKIWIIVGSDGGDTCYIGSASSEQRCRIYNKERQSEDISYTRAWRYEVVFKNDLACSFARNLSGRADSQSQYCLETCHNWLLARGVRLQGVLLQSTIALPLQRSLPTDVERKLEWLETQVKPTIKYLCELGFRDTLLASLFPIQAED